MQWRILKRLLPFIAGIISGAPGVLNTFEFWRMLVGDMSPVWQGVLIGSGGLLILIGLIMVISSYWRTIVAILVMILTETPPAIWIYGALIIFLVVAITYIDTRPEPNWSHPTLSISDQEKTKAECRMAAYDSIGPGSGKVMDSTSSARSVYVANCLIANGFIIKRANND
ncbi:MAG: hypothetical protein OXF79_02880 [Chloroflexi bacterium]|nr:hypothetical protein [Chloroflexota bacterium]